ncbi:MAG: TlyA family RNA methyltransferase, partial [Bacteroidales bacterium]|nr:TlyA family RNA methyltransferase [Bacteroidales bacterium]
MRLDKYLVEKQLFPSREKAQTAIRHNTVKVNGCLVSKSSLEVDDSMQVEVIDIFNKYVSMGGLKLEKAIEDFELSMDGLRILDVGASTGGFTDCALQHGASRVVAVDVGTQQLA